MRKVSTLILKYCFIAVLCFYFSPAEAQQVHKGEVPITTKSDEARQLYKEAREQFYQIKIPDALITLDKAIALDPDFASAHMMKASLTWQEQDIFQQHFQKAVSLKAGVSEGERLLIENLEYIIDDKQEEALAALEELVQLYPDDKHANQLLGEDYYLRGKTDEAIIYLERAVAIDPDYAPAYNTLGYSYRDKGDYAKAEEILKSYIRLSPAVANPYDSMGELLLKQSRYDEAIQYYKKAAELDPAFNYALRSIGHCLMLMGRIEDSRKAYEYAESKATNYKDRIDNLLAMADTYLQVGQYENALKLADKAAKVMEESRDYAHLASIQFLNGEVYLQINDLANVKKSIETAEALLSQNTVLPAQKAHIQQQRLFLEAMVAAKAKDFKQASAKAEEYKKGAEGDKVKNYHKLAGILAFEAGDMQKAIKHLEQADQRNPRVLYVQSLAQAKTGNSKRADELSKKLDKLNQPGFEYALVKAEMAKKP